MKILVIGATGYVGAHIARRLAGQGHAVTGFARDEPGAAKLRAVGHRAYVGDISDAPGLQAEALDADATVFAPQLMLEQESAVVSGLLDAYRGTGKTFIFTSGTGVLGQRTGGDWSEDSFAEDDAFVPQRAIAVRVQTEERVRAACASGVRAMVVRPPMVWGHGRFPVAELMLESLRKTGAVCYIGTGLNLYSNVHVDDLADLYRLAIERGVAGALYHGVSGELNNRCIAEFIARRLGCTTRSVTMDEAIEIWGKFAPLIVLGVSSRSRSPRARKELGWEPMRFDLIDEILDGRIPL
jgi:nucleoside-diphosphate-sugar epimerase